MTQVCDNVGLRLSLSHYDHSLTTAGTAMDMRGPRLPVLQSFTPTHALPQPSQYIPWKLRFSLSDRDHALTTAVDQRCPSSLSLHSFTPTHTPTESPKCILCGSPTILTYPSLTRLRPSISLPPSHNLTTSPSASCVKSTDSHVPMRCSDQARSLSMPLSLTANFLRSILTHPSLTSLRPSISLPSSPPPPPTHQTSPSAFCTEFWRTHLRPGHVPQSPCPSPCKPPQVHPVWSPTILMYPWDGITRLGPSPRPPPPPPTATCQPPQAHPVQNSNHSHVPISDPARSLYLWPG